MAPSVPASASSKGMAGDLLQQLYKLARTPTHCPSAGKQTGASSPGLFPQPSLCGLSY